MLTDFGVRLMGRMTEPTTLALARVVIAAAEKFPNVGGAFYEAGPRPPSVMIRILGAPRSISARTRSKASDALSKVSANS